MTIIPYQLPLFEDFDFGPLQKLEDLFNAINYAPLIKQLDDERKNGRNDYSNDAMFRCMLTSTFFPYPTLQAFIDELKRNPCLRHVCRIVPKYNPDGSKQLAPSNAAFTRFEKKLVKHTVFLENMMQDALIKIKEVCPDLGKTLAIDGKIIPSYAKRRGKGESADGRREMDASYTCKTYTVNQPNGVTEIKKKPYFGYRLHLIVDTHYEIPLALKVCPAHESERTVAKNLINHALPKWLVESCDYMTADRGYDGRPFQALIESKGMTPIIAICNRWKDETTRQYKDTRFVYTYNGVVSYISPKGESIVAKYKGYHKQTDSLRYEVELSEGKESVLIERSTDFLVFNKVARDSKKFKRLYKSRTAVERVNGRYDRDYCFENHNIRGLEKMTLRITLSTLVMIGKRLSTIKEVRQVA